tara:strand:+ start:543 stop:809 length:267 start_codon:yes stop_codon:yes gene_type:complete
MAATAAAVVAQRRRHEAAEAAANLAEGKEGTPRARPLSPKKKPKKVEMQPTLPYQQEVFDFYQNEKIQIFVAVRGPRAAASRYTQLPP